ncbi:MAG TPA: M14 family zinc carboxypeptidase [Ignavibacteriaceae bacterium]|nr:M14 family zinc carboxypeptidase [Ignavibacteriaceae bacterium]
MKFLLSLICILLIAAGVQAQTYRLVKIYINDRSDIQYLYQAGLEFDNASLTKENTLNVFLNDEEFSKLQMTGFNYEVLIDDWAEYYNNLPKLTEQEKQDFIRQSKENYNVDQFGFGSMGGYYTLAEVTAQLDSMRLHYPDLISVKQSIGTTVENRQIYMVKISDNPDINENEPQVLFTAIHHAREPEGMEQLMYFMYYLLENYEADPSVKYLVDHREIYCIPVVNPDGYEYNHQMAPNGGYMWRKNKKDNDGNGVFSEYYDGVDLNRNYGPYAYWNSSNGGSSTDPGSETYRGTAPFSEFEAAAIRDFLAAHNINCELNYHAFGEDMIYPYGAIDAETPDSVIFREFSSDMTAYNGYLAGRDVQTVGYSTRGNSDDYAYDGDTTANHGKIIAMTPEVGNSSDYFWPPQSRIIPIAQQNLMPNLYFTWVAGEFIKLEHPNYAQQYFNPGDVVEMSPSFRNKGLSAGSNIEINLSSLSAYAAVINGTANFSSIPARTSVSVSSSLSFSIDGSAPVEENIKLLVTVSTDGVLMSNDTLNIIIGIPTYVFVDSTNDPNNLWTITATPSNPKWEATTTSFVSAPNSYTDSKNGNYLSNATVTMSLTNPLDLSLVSNPRLSYWTKWDIETDYDYGQVKISTNGGSNWTPLQGMYMNPGTGTFQPNGQPLYDGAQSDWVKEEILLTPFSLTNVKFQFQLKSDQSLNRDGWYLDDIGVIYYTLIPVELNSFTVNTEDESVLLNWQTATETNNKGFEIQRAAGTQHNAQFKTIGFIQGNGTTTEISRYNFNDNSPLQGKSIYRLKQIDFNGTFRVYGPIEVDYRGVTEYALSQNYPNPFNPSTIIKYAMPQAGNVEIKIYNLLGAEVATLVNEYKEAGKYSVEFSTENLAAKIGSGVYFYSIKTGSYVKTRKMMLLR